jgi:hypothetical protein
MGSMTDGPQGCGGHAGLPGELRALVLLALDRIAPLLERVGSEPVSGAATCANCPVCAVLAALRGERPELAVRLAEQASGLLAVLRTALEEGDPGPHPEPAAPPPPPARPVQRIHVERVRSPR